MQKYQITTDQSVLCQLLCNFVFMSGLYGKVMLFIVYLTNLQTRVKSDHFLAHQEYAY